MILTAVCFHWLVQRFRKLSTCLTQGETTRLQPVSWVMFWGPSTRTLQSRRFANVDTLRTQVGIVWLENDMESETEVCETHCCVGKASCLPLWTLSWSCMYYFLYYTSFIPTLDSRLFQKHAFFRRWFLFFFLNTKVFRYASPSSTLTCTLTFVVVVSVVSMLLLLCLCYHPPSFPPTPFTLPPSSPLPSTNHPPSFPASQHTSSLEGISGTRGFSQNFAQT